MFKFSVIGILILLIAGSLNLCAGNADNLADQKNSKNNSQRNYPQAANYRAIPIPQLKEQKINSGEYNIEGFVVKIYTCPPCPPNVQCKPCMRDNIVVSTDNKKLETYNLSSREVILFGKDVQQFQLNQKYLFSIKVTGEKTTSESINDIELFGYSMVKD